MDRKKILIGLVLICFGLFLLGKTTGIFHFSFGDIFPYSIIAVGIWLIIRKKQMIDRAESGSTGLKINPAEDLASPGSRAPEEPLASERAGAERQSQTTQSPSFQNGKVRYNKFIGDMQIHLRGVNLQNVEISSFIAEIDLYLKDGILNKGLNRIIISGFIGEIRIYAPRDLPLFFHGSNFVGDIEIGVERSSGFGNSLDWQTADYQSAESKVYIAANCFLGDLKVILI